MSDLQHNTAEAIDFLRHWPCAMPQLTAIPIDPVTHQKQPLVVKSFTYDPETKQPDWDEIRKWIDSWQGKANIYFTTNRLARPLQKKPSKADISSVVCLHVDVDVPDDATDQTGTADAIVNGLMQYDPPPSVVTMSGGGAQAFWFLRTPVAIGGNEQEAEEIERYTRGIEDSLSDVRGADADKCHNVDRIMRLPGTINVPDIKKLEKKGRSRALAKLVFADWDRKYSLDQFKPAPPKHAAEKDNVISGSTARELSPAEWNARKDEVAALFNTFTIESLRARHVPEACLVLLERGDVEGEYNDDSKMLCAIAGYLQRAGLSMVETCAVVGTLSFPGCAHIEKLPHGQRYRAMYRVVNKAAADGNILSQYDWVTNANKFLEEKCPTLKYYKQDLLVYEDKKGAYSDIEDGAIRSMARAFLHSKKVIVKRGKMFVPEPFNPNMHDVSELISAAKDCSFLGSRDSMPFWLDDRDGPDPKDLISFPNGILDLRTGKLMAPDNKLFTTNAVRFDYEPDAPPPKEWLRFLDQIFAGEQDQIGALQEQFGYSLTADVSQEKAHMWIGPKRSGKDTMKNMLCEMLSEGNVCGPTLDLLAKQFGMSGLINKQVAIVGDMRLSAKADQDVLAEHVLKLTGRGIFTVDRKYKGQWTGRIPCKLLLISNERPRVRDVSGAFASRFITLQTRTSFFGQEDPTLFERLLKPEAPSVLNWALEGLHRMRERGKLAEPVSSVKSRQAMAREGSPVLAFVEECCALDADAFIDKDELHAAYATWSASVGLFVKDKTVFMRDLESVASGKVMLTRMMKKGVRVPVVKGIRLNKAGGDADLFPIAA